MTKEVKTKNGHTYLKWKYFFYIEMTNNAFKYFYILKNELTNTMIWERNIKRELRLENDISASVEMLKVHHKKKILTYYKQITQKILKTDCPANMQSERELKISNGLN